MPDVDPELPPASLEISPSSKARPIPPAYEHIQVNGCKTPGCVNFGVPPREGLILKGRLAGRDGDGYVIVGFGSTDLRCTRCGKHTRLKSNKGIYEELRRQGSYLWVKTPLCCPDEACANHLPDRCGEDRLFRKYGRTRSGSDRWQCCLCHKTFSLGKPTLRQQKPHVNHLAFKLLVNKTPISRMMEVLEVDARTVYRKIDFIYEQCRLFAAAREMRLPGMTFDRLYLCTDRQDYLVNWGSRSARKTIQLTAVATGDLMSGYLFGLTPNFDPSIDPKNLQAAVEQAEDDKKAYPLRDFARLWTESDYRNSTFRAATGSAHKTARADLDAPELLTLAEQLPSQGAQVHADYLMHGHYWLLRYLLGRVGKLRFYLDQDFGLLSSCFGAFADRIADRTADVVVVDIEKNLTTPVRQSKQAEAKRWFEAQASRYPGKTGSEIRTLIMAERIAAARALSDNPRHALQSEWIEHPFPDLAEPVKRFRFATDYGDMNDEHLASLLNLGTLWPVDTTFNRIRRRLSYCERPIRSNRRTNGLWQIYAPYDPAMVEKVLFIYRVWNNYVWVSPKSKKTAAERIGLAAGKIRTQDILYFDVRRAIENGQSTP